MRTIDPTDIPLVPGLPPGGELRMREEGDLMVAYVKLPAGADATELFKGLPDGCCQCPHWGWMISGRVITKDAHGQIVEYPPGQAFYWAPGHIPLALEDSEYVDFSPIAEFRALIEHMQKTFVAASDA
jgi:hypothetical protein